VDGLGCIASDPTEDTERFTQSPLQFGHAVVASPPIRPRILKGINRRRFHTIQF